MKKLIIAISSFLVIATSVNQNVRNTEVQKIVSASEVKLGRNVLLATHSKNMFSGKLITSANAVSLTDSLKDSLSMLTLRPD